MNVLYHALAAGLIIKEAEGETALAHNDIVINTNRDVAANTDLKSLGDIKLAGLSPVKVIREFGNVSGGSGVIGGMGSPMGDVTSTSPKLEILSIKPLSLPHRNPNNKKHSIPFRIKI